jgi:enoyl-CoA hydratase/carnithine racemase
MSVETSRHGRALVVRMAREEKRNALNPAITAGIDAATNRLVDDSELWCDILTGGERVFSAGADLRTGPVSPSSGTGSTPRWTVLRA